LLRFEREQDDWQTPEQMLAVMTRFAAVHNARIEAQGSFA